MASKPKPKPKAPKSKAAKPKSAGDTKRKPKPAAAKGDARPNRRKWWLAALLLLILGIMFPFAEVGYVRFFPPPVTTLMLFRKIEGMFSSEFKGGIDYKWVSLEQVSPDFIEAVWVAEDERFFDHDGIDWKEIAIAQEQAKRSGKPIRGASTISMQCARTVFLWQGRSYIRKGMEFFYTKMLEEMTSKRRILELYVNTVELGDGIYGVEAASRHYFKKSARDLNRIEAAMIAALLPFPRGWNPHDPSPRLRGRHQMILRKMRGARFPVEKLERGK